MLLLKNKIDTLQFYFFILQEVRLDDHHDVFWTFVSSYLIQTSFIHKKVT